MAAMAARASDPSASDSREIASTLDMAPRMVLTVGQACALVRQK
jgi:hypothetical protein